MTKEAVKKNWKKVWWVRSLVAVVLFAVGYGLASWAIDSGSLLLYGLAVICLYIGIFSFVRSVRMFLSK